MKTASLLAILLVCLSISAISFGQGPMQQAKPSPGDVAKLTKLEKAYKAAKNVLASTPKSAKAKADFCLLGTAYARELTYTPVLGSKVKYRQALHVYREVLKADPSQKQAKSDSD